MREERELIQAFGRAADGYDREKVVGAAANMLLNALRQAHPKLGGASEELRDLHDRMQKALAEHHYSTDGLQRKNHIILPSPREMLTELR